MAGVIKSYSASTSGRFSVIARALLWRHRSRRSRSPAPALSPDRTRPDALCTLPPGGFFLLVAAGLLCLAPSATYADCRSVYDSELNEVAWSELRESRYTICYDSRFAEDADLAERWINNAFDIAETKYNVVAPVQRRGHDLEITIFLAPHPTSRANRFRATVTCCSDEVSLEIHIMSPSAPEYGRPEDDFIKTLTHEMMNTLHYEAREPPNISPPLWVREGLAEYEGYYTTSGNEAKIDGLIEYVYDHLQGEILYGYSLEGSTPTIVSVDRYRASAAVMIFFAERFGEEIHYKLFEKPMNEALADYGVETEAAFRELDEWLDQKYSTPPTGPDSYVPSMACTGRYWRSSSGLSFEVRILNNGQRPSAHDAFQSQYRRDASRPWTTKSSVALVRQDSSGFSTPLFTSTSSPPFQWRARSCPLFQPTDRSCSAWSNTINWTAATCARERL